MLKGRIAPLLAMLFVALFAQSARAFFDPPYITPAASVAGELVSINIPFGLCDAIGGGGGGYPHVTQNGNAIRVVFFGVHTTNSDYCIYPIGTATKPFGIYTAGSYTVQVDVIYDNYPFGYATMTLGTLPLVIASSGASITSVPANSLLSQLTLLFVLPGLALWALHARRSVALILSPRRAQPPPRSR